MTEFGVSLAASRNPQYIGSTISCLATMGKGWKWWRNPVDVQTLCPTQGAYDATFAANMASIEAAAAAAGIKTLWNITGTPSWAGATTIAPYSNVVDYAAICAHLVTLYPGRVWEIWNEPNYAPFWSGTAAQYVAMLQAAYTAMKAADPTCTIVGAALSGPSSTLESSCYDFLTACYAAGMHGYCDAVSAHPYDRPTQPQMAAGYDPRVRSYTSPTTSMVDAVNALRTIMASNGDSTLPLWITEWGYSADANLGDPQPAVGPLTFTPAQQALLGYEYLMALMTVPNVPVIIWYLCQDAQLAPGVDPASYFNNSNFAGLFDASLASKPVVAALRALTDPSPRYMSGGTGRTRWPS